ncbi:putative holin [Mycobacterium sp. SM1]|uniref:putative holin n=1 Tax=Mycobacterium sp. SM1 TaxID=2816243 RepID=UPI001BD12612|nr:putative holin [Mycobacterium sp. SM1]MBS4728446.1 putative holin [Mycobacterium sp. SM1]
MIPLPRSWLLSAAMVVGLAAGWVAGSAATVLVPARVRPDAVIALVAGVPVGVGLLLILFSRRRWITALGAFALAVAPGWFGVLVTIQAVCGA